MPDYPETIAQALGGDVAAYGALYSATVATIYYSALRITGDAAAAQAVCVHAYRLAFANLARLAYPESFPIWLDWLSVYIAYRTAAARYGGGELSEARARLVAFLRDFHGMNDEEIAALLEADPAQIAACGAQSEPLDPEDFNMDRETVLSIWHAVLRVGTAAPAEAPRTDAPAAKAAVPEPGGAERERGGAAREERKRKQRRRLALRLSAALAVCLVLGGAVWGALRVKDPGRSSERRRVNELANKLSLQLSGRVGEIYQLSDDLYFVSINLGYGGVEGLVVQYELAENQIRLSSPDSALTQEQLEKLSDKQYMQVLYNPGASGSGRLDTEASDAQPGDAQPSPAPAETPAPTKTPVTGEASGGDYELVQSEDFSIMLRVNCRNVDLSRPMTIVLDSAISNAVGEAGGVQIVLNDTRYCITLSTEQLGVLCGEYGSVTLRFSALSERQYSISFYSDDGKLIPELTGTMTFTLPADGPLTYVFAVYDGGTESRGGIYDKKNGTISFPVGRSGRYEIIGREIEIRDIGKLDEESAAAAYFLASLEFVTLDDDGRFRPDETLTRSEVMELVGRMFLATDRRLTSEYPDVDLSDPAYSYITFGTSSAILTGLGDGTFGGDADATREELLTICGRTLLYRLGIDAPAEDAEIPFDDANLLDDYARPAVAALTAQGVLTPGGALRPREPATRVEAAVLLYRMYCRLYGYKAD